MVLAGCSPAIPTSIGPTITPAPSSPTPTPIPDIAPTRTLAPLAAFVTFAQVEVTGTFVEVAGFVQGIEADGATCRYSLTPADGGDSVVTDFESIANVGTTSCGIVKIPVASLHRGSWRATLELSASGAIAVSEPLALEVP